jgi:cell division protein FtsZ
LEGVDTMIVIPNEKLLSVAKDAGFFESFRVADDVLLQAVQGISDIITIPGIINRDFADVKTTMAGMGYAVMGTALRSGENRAIAAAQAAMASPLLEAGAIDGARGILINISGSSTLKLSEVNVASTLIQNAAHEDANIIFGAVLDERMGDEIKITVIATGFKQDQIGRQKHSAHEAVTPRVLHTPASPRFASEESAEQEFTPRLDTKKTFESAAPVMREPEPASFALQPQPVLVEESAENGRTPVPTRANGGNGNYKGSFEEEYARLVPAKAERGQESSHRAGNDSHLENLDIPAFLRRQ